MRKDDEKIFNNKNRQCRKSVEKEVENVEKEKIPTMIPQNNDSMSPKKN